MALKVLHVSKVQAMLLRPSLDMFTFPDEIFSLSDRHKAFHDPETLTQFPRYERHYYRSFALECAKCMDTCLPQQSFFFFFLRNEVKTTEMFAARLCEGSHRPVCVMPPN